MSDRRSIRADEVLSKRRLLDQIVVGEVGAHPGAEHRRGRHANRAGDLREIVPEVVADAERRGPGFTGRRLDQDEDFLLAAGPRPQTHAAGAAGARDVDLNPRDAALRAIQIVQVLEERIDIWLLRTRCPGGRSARAHGYQGGGNHETKRGTHRLLADRSRRCHLLQDRGPHQRMAVAIAGAEATPSPAGTKRLIAENSAATGKSPHVPWSRHSNLASRIDQAPSAHCAVSSIPVNAQSTESVGTPPALSVAAV